MPLITVGTRLGGAALGVARGLGGRLVAGGKGLVELSRAQSAKLAAMLKNNPRATLGTIANLISTGVLVDEFVLSDYFNDKDVKPEDKERVRAELSSIREHQGDVDQLFLDIIKDKEANEKMTPKGHARIREMAKRSISTFGSPAAVANAIELLVQFQKWTALRDVCLVDSDSQLRALGLLLQTLDEVDE